MPRQQALGDAIGDRFELVVAEPQRAPDRRGGRPRRHHVQAHIQWCEFRRQGAHLRGQRRLAGDIGAEAGECRADQEGADEHHRGGLGQLVAQRGEGVQRAGAVDRPLPVEGGHVQPVGEFGNAGVGYQVMHRSQLRSTAGQPGQVVGRRHVALQPLQLFGMGFQHGLEPAEAARHRQHPRAPLQQGCAQGQTDSGTGTGDHGQAILKLAFHHHLRARRTPSHRLPRGGSGFWVGCWTGRCAAPAPVSGAAVQPGWPSTRGASSIGA